MSLNLETIIIIWNVNKISHINKHGVKTDTFGRQEFVE